jgi:hypothetical protein
MPAQAPHYLSFMLRCWWEPSQTSSQPMIWRFSLEDVETSERFGFPDIEALIVFLQTQIAPTSPPTEADI